MSRSRVPWFTLAFLATMIVANARAGTFSGTIDPEALAARGIGLEALRDSDATRLLTATFLSHDDAMLLRQIVFAALVIGMTERRRGSLRAATLFFGLDLGTTLLLLAAVAWVPALDGLSDVTDVGMSLGGFGLIGLLLTERRRGVLLALGVLVLIALKSAAAPEPLADAGHAIGLVLGVGIGLFLRRPDLASGPRPGQNGQGETDGRTT